MKPFKQLLTELSDTPKKSEILIFSKDIDFIPLHPSTLTMIYQKYLYLDAWHYTDWNGLDNLLKIQKSPKSISATSYAPWSNSGEDFFSNGVMTNGGVAVHVMGRVLISHEYDVFSAVDEHGLRWISSGFLSQAIQDSVWELKKNIMRDFDVQMPEHYGAPNDVLLWSLIPHLLPTHDVEAIRYRYLKGCSDLINHHREDLAKYLLRTPSKFGRHDMEDRGEIIMNNFKILKVAFMHPKDAHDADSPDAFEDRYRFMEKLHNMGIQSGIVRLNRVELKKFFL